jgi:ribosomal protein S18 acetylase RimI-like enzyme
MPNPRDSKMIAVRTARPDEVPALSLLASKVFREFIEGDYGEEGRRNFLQFAAVRPLRERLAFGHLTLVAELDATLAGMIQVRLPAHVLMLFVDGAFHRRGVARSLLEAALARIRGLHPQTLQVTVNASPYAVEAYRALGFELAGARDATDGVITVPMVKRLDEPA